MHATTTPNACVYYTYARIYQDEFLVPHNGTCAGGLLHFAGHEICQKRDGSHRPALRPCAVPLFMRARSVIPALGAFCLHCMGVQGNNNRRRTC